jgi:hypothetical protein
MSHSETYTPIIMDNDKRNDALNVTKIMTTGNSDSSSSDSYNSNDALINIKYPSTFNGETHDDYYKKFVEFHQNPSRTINRKPFATGRHSHRHRTHKCKPCKRRRSYTKKRRISHRRKRHYKKGRKSHKRRN